MFLFVIKLVLFGGIETRSDSVAQVSLELMVILLLQLPEDYQTLKQEMRKEEEEEEKVNKGSRGRGHIGGRRGREEEMVEEEIEDL